MTISGIGSVYSYASYTNRIDSTRNVEEVSQPVPVESVINSKPQVPQKELQTPKALESENFEKLQFDFKKDNEYNLVGAQSQLEDLDLDQALSDMEKDSVLDQYKFFVRSSLVNNEDGSVRQVIRN